MTSIPSALELQMLFFYREPVSCCRMGYSCSLNGAFLGAWDARAALSSLRLEGTDEEEGGGSLGGVFSAWRGGLTSLCIQERTAPWRAGPLTCPWRCSLCSARQGLATNLAPSQGPCWGLGGRSQAWLHSPRRAVSPVAGDRLHSRANLPCTVSGVDLCAVQETPQAWLLNPPVTTGGRAGCQSVHRPPVICRRRRSRGEKHTA